MNIPLPQVSEEWGPYMRDCPVCLPARCGGGILYPRNIDCGCRDLVCSRPTRFVSFGIS
jgi:hypothetical protein